MSFGLQHLKKSNIAKTMSAQIENDIQKVIADPKLSDKIDPHTGMTQREGRITDYLTKISPTYTKAVYEESLKENNPLAEQVKSGARGNPTNLRSLRGADIQYVDHHNKPIPIPITKSYSEGLTPAMYFGGSFGARAGLVSTKFAVQDSGAFSKLLNQAAHRLIVTDIDDENYDGTLRGLPMPTDDPDNAGALLAQNTGPYERNEVLTPAKLKHLHDLGHEKIIIRSPAVGGAPDGGLYANDVGVRERGMIAPVGDNVGIAAAQSVSELLNQAQLCLARGTRVKTGTTSYKFIEDIKVGNTVIGADKHGNWFKTKVTNVYSNGLKYCYHYKFKISNTNYFLNIESTPEHRLLCKDHEGKKALRPIGDEEGELIACRQVFDKTEKQVFTCRKFSFEPLGLTETYDLEVDHPDHMFILDNGIIVENSSKHTGGVAGAGKAAGGFELINQLVQVPKTFKGGATHSQEDGKIEDIRPAPAGGWYVDVNGREHYVHTGHDVTVKKGDTVEAGDLLSDGIPNPADLVQHKGIGEGRRSFIHQYKKAYTDSDMYAHRRNVELVARGLINHVKLNDEIGDYIPGDIVPYQEIEHVYQPRPGFMTNSPKNSLGKYLEKPVLHYTIGTHIKPSVVKELEHFKVPNIITHNDPPPFEPQMIRAAANLSYDNDWFTKLLGSNLQKNLLQSTWRGARSDEAGTSFVPGLARGVDFGEKGLVKDWHSSSETIK